MVRKSNIIFVLFAVVLFLSIHSTSRAEVFSSTNFQVLDPVIDSAGGRSTSASYILLESLGELSVGTSTITNFTLNSGFLTFPAVTTPAVTATAGDGEVSLSWTSSTGFLGWTVSGYTVGQSTTSGGPYTYTSLGNVTSSTRTGLSNGTTYYFVILPEDIFGNTIGTSTEVLATPASSGDDDDGGGGGGGGGGITLSSGSVTFKGRAYPNSFVTLLKDGNLAVRTLAGPDANFEISLSNLSTGDFIFSLFGEDKDGRRSPSIGLPVTLSRNASTVVSGIYLAPSIATDKSEVKRGDTIAIFGQSAPNSSITIVVNSHQEFFEQTESDESGVYLLNFETTPLENGQHSTKSRGATSTEVSQFGFAVNFLVGNRNVLAAEEICPQKGDMNDDCRVNLVDFSIAAFWYQQTLSAPVLILEKVKLSGDGEIDLRDFSIMAYYWTG